MRDLINKIVVEGRLGKDAEIVEFNEKQMTRFDIAHNGDSTTWVPVRVFGPNLIKMSSKLTKGTLVKVTGSLRQRKLVANGKSVDYLYVRAVKINKTITPF